MERVLFFTGYFIRLSPPSRVQLQILDDYKLHVKLR